MEGWDIFSIGLVVCMAVVTVAGIIYAVIETRTANRKEKAYEEWLKRRNENIYAEGYNKALEDVAKMAVQMIYAMKQEVEGEVSE